MSDIAIRVEGLGKRYRIGARRERYYTLRDTITETFAWPFRKFSSLFSRDGSHLSSLDPALSSHSSGLSTLDPSTFWALKDVSFEVKRGEVLGIIGRNGAGKTTLLKILSRITEPTKGQADINGRVGSLLEVGTGFHLELTGRENIYLNAAILGMKKSEVERKFGDIVGFAEIEKFIDTPVKRYSSGMYVRLAFAVAAHLDPEVLLVDEVLAVGDAEFQKKCLGKMEDVAKRGRTVLFVSHNMLAIQSLCSRALFLEGGCLTEDGDVDFVIRRYLQKDVAGGERVWRDALRAPGNDTVQLQAVRVLSCNGQAAGEVSSDEDFSIQIEYRVIKKGESFNVGVYLFNDKGIQVFTSIDSTDSVWTRPRQTGTYRSMCHIPSNLLAPGQYNATVQIKKMSPSRLHFREPGAIIFDVKDATGGFGGVFREFRGVIRPVLKWDSEFEPDSQPSETLT